MLSLRIWAGFILNLKETDAISSSGETRYLVVKNTVWMNNTDHVGIPDVNPILLAKGYSDENLLWDQRQTQTRFTMTGIMNEIVFPPEVKGFTVGPEYRDDLLQIVYLMGRLKRRQQFDKKQQQEIS